MNKWKGVLDHLDEAERLLGELRPLLVETLEPATIRRQNILCSNARSALQQARLMLEREKQITAT